MLYIRKILCPIDFSANAEQALAVARLLARDHQAELTLLSVVVVPPPAPEMMGITDGTSELVAISRRQVQALVEKIPDVLADSLVIVGDPGWTIVRTAEDCGCDLIVMGTHGRSGVSRLLLGSVAEYVLRHAACPVLTIKSGTAQHLQNDRPLVTARAGR